MPRRRASGTTWRSKLKKWESIAFRRLQTDYLDVWQIHAISFDTALTCTPRARTHPTKESSP